MRAGDEATRDISLEMAARAAAAPAAAAAAADEGTAEAEFTGNLESAQDAGWTIPCRLQQMSSLWRLELTAVEFYQLQCVSLDKLDSK